MTKETFRGVWGPKAESLPGRCLPRARVPSFSQKYGVPLLTLVLPNLWHQLPLLKGLVPVGTEDTSPRSIPRSGSPKTTPRALWTGRGGSPFCLWPLCQP